MKTLYYIISVLLFFSCSKSNKSNSFLETPLKTVDSHLYNADLMIKYCGKMLYNNNCLLLTFAGIHRENVVVSAEDGTELGTLGRRGQGPGEYIVPLFCSFSANGDSTSIYDMSKGNVLVYATDYQKDTFSVKYAYSIKPPEWHLYYNLMRLKNGLYVAQPLERKVGEPAYDLLDSKLNVIAQFGNVPIKLYTDFTDFRKIYDNASMSVYGNKVFIALFRIGYIAGYEISDNGEITTLFEKLLVEPNYKSSDGYIVLSKDKNMLGALDITASEDFIFITWSGKYMSDLKEDGTGLESESIAVFDHKGNLVSRVKMNNIGQKIGVSTDGKTLYTCTLYPEFDIESYNIADLVK
jgi:hypothetical protein